MISTADHIKAIELAAQIDVLKELDYNTVYIGEGENRAMKSVILMDNLIKTLADKRSQLAIINRDVEVANLRKQIEELKTTK